MKGWLGSGPRSLDRKAYGRGEPPSPVDRYEDARLCTLSVTCRARVPQPPRWPLRLLTRTAIAGAMSSLLIPSGEPVLVFGERYA